MHILGHMLFGLVVGIVAKLIMPGHHPGGIIATMLLGIVGAFLGGFIGRAVGMYPPGHPAGFFMAVIGACVVIALYGWLTRNTASTTAGVTGASLVMKVSVPTGPPAPARGRA